MSKKTNQAKAEATFAKYSSKWNNAEFLAKDLDRYEAEMKTVPVTDLDGYKVQINGEGENVESQIANVFDTLTEWGIKDHRQFVADWEDLKYWRSK